MKTTNYVPSCLECVWWSETDTTDPKCPCMKCRVNKDSFFEPVEKDMWVQVWVTK